MEESLVQSSQKSEPTLLVTGRGRMVTVELILPVVLNRMPPWLELLLTPYRERFEQDSLCEDYWMALLRLGPSTRWRDRWGSIKSEALTLKWDSVDLKRGLVAVEAAYAKNGRTRSIPLNSTVSEALKVLRSTATSESVFVNEDGKPYNCVGSIFKRACSRANLTGVTPHTLRHTFASRLVMAGVDLRTVQELGGWQTLAMVERYAHLSPAHKAQAVERIAWQAPNAVEKSVLLVAW